ncbi:MAG: 2-amino-4-hydroxy-6-hydroxymethyldihydropteridine diphosphokinase [Pseudomonadota bacterium]
MIIIGLGANLDSQFGTPVQTLSAVKDALRHKSIEIIDQSRIWKTEPYPKGSDQPWYHNAVLNIKTILSPEALLDELFTIENHFGRVRTTPNAPRIIDLDLIAFEGQVIHEDNIKVPHPRMHERLFVLNPLSDIDENWVHPLLQKNASDLIADLDNDFETEALDIPW